MRSCHGIHRQPRAAKTCQWTLWCESARLSRSVAVQAQNITNHTMHAALACWAFMVWHEKKNVIGYIMADKTMMIVVVIIIAVVCSSLLIGGGLIAWKTGLFSGGSTSAAAPPTPPPDGPPNDAVIYFKNGQKKHVNKDQGHGPLGPTLQDAQAGGIDRIWVPKKYRLCIKDVKVGTDPKWDTGVGPKWIPNDYQVDIPHSMTANDAWVRLPTETC